MLNKTITNCEIKNADTRSIDMNDAMQSTDAEQHPLCLTRKEQQVLHQILEGRSNAEISANFSRSIRTIEAHVSSILSKFNAQNRLEVIIRTQNEPWLNPA
ncbi:response regulator transcription factor [Arenicella xantha]|uniref:response regulator transcription factor n=1 Tax=Arenicella xantha TaxID=644221 RepID=UPI001B86A7FA|nr:helix-turn-helix transcriptional regulator [Arenicella xantha]